MARTTLTHPATSKKPRRIPARGDARRHPRFPVALAVKITERMGEEPGCWRGRTADVSGGGFAIELPAKLDPGKKLKIEVRTGIGPLRLEAEVLWARKVAGRKEVFHYGFRLAEGSEVLDLPVSVLLGEWLRKLAREEGKVDRDARPRSRRPPGRDASR
ncbi:MAG: PilZ domain-containing protein [candidate division NC10 bacterium]|nr:PilZ domain-containing protein [candidate division NC10 bacterium]